MSLFSVYVGFILHVVSVVMMIWLADKLNKSQYSSAATFLYIFILATVLGLAGALCRASAFSCKYYTMCLNT